MENQQFQQFKSRNPNWKSRYKFSQILQATEVNRKESITSEQSRTDSARDKVEEMQKRKGNPRDFRMKVELIEKKTESSVKNKKRTQKFDNVSQLKG